MLLTIVRGRERHHRPEESAEAWLTPHPRGSDPLASGTVATLEERRLRPMGGSRLPPYESEILTYVREGTIVYGDSASPHRLLTAGEFQRTTRAQGVDYSEANPSATRGSHVFQLSLQSTGPALDQRREQRRFSISKRRGRLRLVASPDARNGSLRLDHDVAVYSAILKSGHHIARELSTGHLAWLHVVHGSLTVGRVILRAGDAAAFEAEGVLAFTAREDTEVLLLDYGDRGHGPVGSEHGSRSEPRDDGRRELDPGSKAEPGSAPNDDDEIRRSAMAISRWEDDGGQVQPDIPPTQAREPRPEFGPGESANRSQW